MAQRKAAGLLEAGAAVTVISPQVTPELERLAGEGSLQLVRQVFMRGMSEVKGAALLFAATDDAAVNAAVREEGAAQGIWVNGADEADHGDFLLPAVLRQGRLTISVSTGGASPGLSRLVRNELQGWLDDGYEAYLDLMLELRLAVQQLVSDTEVRQKIFRSMLEWDLRARLRDGRGWPQRLQDELLERLRRDPTPEGVRRIGAWMEEVDNT